jgi:SAM-dependent methyltransferase
VSSAAFVKSRALLDAVEERLVPARLSARFTGGDDDRLRRDRMKIIPWLDHTRHLEGVRVLEVGCGNGTSTVALAEQGAQVIGLDVASTQDAAALVAAHGLHAELITANATSIAELGIDAVAWVMFWASLEHMTVDERLASLAAAWSILPTAGLLTVIETPNRLWFNDSHTSWLPFFNWLPDEIAFSYSRYSPRGGFNDLYRHLDDDQLLAFQRRGRGVSFHEFHLALGHDLDIVSCLQLERRRRNPLRAAGWRVSAAGRYEHLLRSAAPQVPPSFLQPFLYLTLRKP